MQKEPGETEPKRRRTQSKYDKEATRYECFCSKQYLSYPALYLHLKNKHQNYFMRTKGGKKVENTKLVETFDSQEGFKVLKIPLTHASLQEFTPQEPPQRSYDQLCYPNYLCLPPYYSQPQDRPFSLKYLNIEGSFTFFMDFLFKGQDSGPNRPKISKSRAQTELLLTLLIKCLNQNYQLLRDPRTTGKNISRYSAEYGSEYVPRIFPFFDHDFLPKLRALQQEPYSFFIKNSHIIGSENYKNILIQLSDFLNEGKGEREVHQESVPEEGEEKRRRRNE